MAEEAKNLVNECEKEIASIKARIKALGPAAPTSEEEPDDAKNSLTVTLVKVRVCVRVCVCALFVCLFVCFCVCFFVRLWETRNEITHGVVRLGLYRVQ